MKSRGRVLLMVSLRSENGDGDEKWIRALLISIAVIPIQSLFQMLANSPEVELSYEPYPSSEKPKRKFRRRLFYVLHKTWH